MLPISEIPNSPLDVLLTPIICVVVGFIVWYLGLRVEFNTEKPFVKWLGLLPMGIGLLIGVNYVYRTFDFAYQALMERKLILYSHYAALLLPLAAIVFVFGWEWHQKRQKAQGVF